MNNIKLSAAKNIGPTIAKRLAGISIYDRGQLVERTPAQAYLDMKAQQPDTTLPKCYYLYTLEGAISNMHRNDLPVERKELLKKQVEERSWS